MRKRFLGTDLEVSAVGFVAFSPLTNGFLSGKYNAQSVFEKNTDYRLIMPQFQKILT